MTRRGVEWRGARVCMCETSPLLLLLSAYVVLFHFWHRRIVSPAPPPRDVHRDDAGVGQKRGSVQYHLPAVFVVDLTHVWDARKPRTPGRRRREGMCTVMCTGTPAITVQGIFTVMCTGTPANTVDITVDITGHVVHASDEVSSLKRTCRLCWIFLHRLTSRPRACQT